MLKLEFILRYKEVVTSALGVCTTPGSDAALNVGPRLLAPIGQKLLELVSDWLLAWPPLVLCTEPFNLATPLSDLQELDKTEIYFPSDKTGSLCIISPRRGLLPANS